MKEPSFAGVPSATARSPMGGVAPVVALVLCVAGMAVSAISTSDHVRFRKTGGTGAGACAALVHSGCRAAHESEMSEVFGIPISHYGTAFYLAGAGMIAFALLRRRRRDPALLGSAVALLIAVMGLGSVGYSAFLAATLIRAGEACPLCIALYAVNGGLLATGLVWWLRGTRRPAWRPLFTSAWIGVGIGGGFFAAGAPFLVRALEQPPVWNEARVDNPAGLRVRGLAIPDRVPSRGPPDAADDLIEFSDIECPHCAALHRTVQTVFAERGVAGLRVRFVHYPLDPSCNPLVHRAVHPTACLMARAGICAHAQERFWEFLDAAFALKGERSRDVALDIARGIGLDMERFVACLDDEGAARTLADDIALAHRAGVRATPTLLINGLTFEGALSPAQLGAVLDDTTPCGCDQRATDVACEGVPEQEKP